MNKIKKQISIFMIIVLVFIVNCFTSYAINNSNNENMYEEIHDQINFDTLNIAIINGKKLDIQIDNSLNSLKKAYAKKQLTKYQTYISNHPEDEKILKDDFKTNNYLCALSYTEAPLNLENGHFERIKKENNSLLMTANAKSNESDSSVRYRLTLKTTIIRSGSSNPYTYTAKTSGEWDNSTSIIGGEKKPAAGLDYIMQSCPVVTSSSSFSSIYNYKTSGSTSGIEGTNYFMEDGGASWVKYSVKDDPAGIAQLHTFTLKQTFKAKATTKTKKINSYYVHTWKSMKVDVTANEIAGVSGGDPVLNVGLSITPSIINNSWNLYNYVSYNW